MPDTPCRCAYHDRRRYIADRRERVLAALTPRQRLARHWSWFWDVYVVVVVVGLLTVLGVWWAL